MRVDFRRLPQLGVAIRTALLERRVHVLPSLWHHLKIGQYQCMSLHMWSSSVLRQAPIEVLSSNRLEDYCAYLRVHELTTLLWNLISTRSRLNSDPGIEENCEGFQTHQTKHIMAYCLYSRLDDQTTPCLPNPPTSTVLFPKPILILWRIRWFVSPSAGNPADGAFISAGIFLGDWKRHRTECACDQGSIVQYPGV